METPTLTEAVATLRELQTLCVPEQQQRIDDLHAAFRVFWASGPTEDEFTAVMGRVLLTARMLYIIVTDHTQAQS